MENLKIRTIEISAYKTKYSILKSDKIGSDGDVAAIVMAVSRLSSGKIDFVLINKTILKRESFLFKTSGNFNATKATDAILYFLYEHLFDSDESYVLCMSKADLQESSDIMNSVMQSH